MNTLIYYITGLTSYTEGNINQGNMFSWHLQHC